MSGQEDPADDTGAHTSDGSEASSVAEPRLVWNPLLGEFLAQSPGRMSRREGTTDCPFCADLHNGRVPPETQAWIRANDFPALTPPIGECYLLIYSRDHDRTFADLRPDEVGRVIGLWQDLYASLSSRYACVMTWETSGAAIGQTQRHPHGQAYGLAVVPPTLAREMASVERAYEQGEGVPLLPSAGRAVKRAAHCGVWSALAGVRAPFCPLPI
jgi:UDPglucose--hexose-1-phosphate uridylyltransferase